MERSASYPGSPPALVLEVFNTIKLSRIGNPEAVQDRGGRSTGSTYDSGPMKPGNSVEDKTLTIRKM